MVAVSNYQAGSEWRLLMSIPWIYQWEQRLSEIIWVGRLRSWIYLLLLLKDVQWTCKNSYYRTWARFKMFYRSKSTSAYCVAACAEKWETRTRQAGKCKVINPKDPDNKCKGTPNLIDGSFGASLAIKLLATSMVKQSLWQPYSYILYIGQNSKADA